MQKESKLSGTALMIITASSILLETVFCCRNYNVRIGTIWIPTGLKAIRN